MHLQLLIGFGAVIWWSRDPPWEPFWSGFQPTIVVVAATTLAMLVAASGSARRLNRTVQNAPPSLAWRRLHRSHQTLNWSCLALFLIQLTLTGWAPLWREAPIVSRIPGAPSLLTICPLILGLITVLWALFPTDSALRHGITHNPADHNPPQPGRAGAISSFTSVTRCS